MTDRRIVYPGAIPQETDVLAPQRYAVEGLGWIAQSVFGTTTTVEGMTVGPNSPAALNVVVQPGAIYAPLALDASAYSTLGADAHTVMQQGLLRDAVTLTITPPATVGQSRVYVVQAACQVVDTDPGVLPYYNAADPDTAFSGPDNSGTPQNTRRAVQAVVSLKAGTAAATGSETAPAPDAGYVELARVTVANGASSVTAGNIVANAALRRKIASLPDIAGLFQNIQYITSSQTWTVPAGVTRVRFRAWAGGGGGGGAANPNSAAAGGGPGAYAEGYLAVTPGQSLGLTVGAGGARGVSGSNGGTGGSTVIAGFVECRGGLGGGGANGVISGSAGAPGIYIITSGVNASGFVGLGAGTGFVTGDSGRIGGAGGAAFCSPAPGGPVSDATTPQPGSDAGLPGAGAPGGVAGGSGGKGADGIIILEY
ncbi:hypothetical protein [Roseomonas chloroacetimidivorans]|uniref:glycine-rich domain-containing protein n=1 Tax=Roseomonas chloroacetimidivorans TaxID=1766656 RepID=UPI003C734C39